MEGSLTDRRSLSDILPSYRTLGYMLMALILTSCFLMVLGSRGHIFTDRQVRTVLFILGNISIGFAAGVLLTFHLTIGTVIMMGAIMALGGLCLFHSRKVFELVSVLSASGMIIGILLSTTGMMRNFQGANLDQDMFLISNPGVLLLGILMFVISSHFVLRRFSISTKEALPHVLLSLAGILILAASLISDASENDDLIWSGPLFFLGMISLMLSGMAFLERFRMESRMGSSRRSIREALRKSHELSEAGKHFYALQQIDRALKENIVDSLGKDERTGDMLRTLQGTPFNQKMFFRSGEYETAHVQKARLLSSQGKLPEATREYMEAITIRPDYLESYSGLGFLLRSMPGKKSEGDRYLKYYITSKKLYLKRLLSEEVPDQYKYFLGSSFTNYVTAVERKAEILSFLGPSSEIWSYYTMMRD